MALTATTTCPAHRVVPVIGEIVRVSQAHSDELTPRSPKHCWHSWLSNGYA